MCADRLPGRPGFAPRYRSIRRSGTGGWTACLLFVALAAFPALGHAQQAQEPSYRREVYEYPRSGRPDPFRAHLGRSNGGAGIPELVLRGVLHHPDPRESVAILVEQATGRRVRARVGERIGNVRVIGIQPRRVDLLVEDAAESRRFSLHLKAEAGAGS